MGKRRSHTYSSPTFRLPERVFSEITGGIGWRDGKGGRCGDDDDVGEDDYLRQVEDDGVFLVRRQSPTEVLL